ncbi:glycoside hydrolase family 71/99-like protein [Neorhodopirellula pilleata]|nr:glycoside hydrolase family 71/99-like protein [Neorhodopirellula pilleata]
MAEEPIRREQRRDTLTGKVMVGYQGWFNCEGDGMDLGWAHWSRNRRRTFGAGNLTVDLWPDMTELDDDERFKTGFVHADGSEAEVFSSANRKTVARHFRWMQEYGIDGAFLQRFASGLRRQDQQRHKDAVLEHVRAGADASGRSYAVMYDLSGLPADGCGLVRDDWAKLRNRGIPADLAYQHHEGKPVVAIWGIGFNDGEKPREYTLSECRELIELLKEDGCCVMLGVPTGWREQNRDSTIDDDLHGVLELADIISPWTVGRYRNEDGIERHARDYLRPDLQWCSERQIDYLPVVFPGFSWHNLTGDKLGAIPRVKGEFLKSQLDAAIQSRCKMIYVAMFDEVDEGTAIFKCTNDPPTGHGAKFLTYEDLPSDHYLKLTGQAARQLRDKLNKDNE